MENVQNETVLESDKVSPEPEKIDRRRRANRSLVTKDGEKKEAELKTKGVILFNTSLKTVKNEDYFFGGVVPSGFNGTCGKPVEREDLLEVFNKVFKPTDDILFYKQDDKEVYLVIIPIKYATTIGDFNNSMEGDFQKHAISFLNEGSVNLDTLKMKLQRINKFVKYSDR